MKIQSSKPSEKFPDNDLDSSKGPPKPNNRQEATLPTTSELPTTSPLPGNNLERNRFEAHKIADLLPLTGKRKDDEIIELRLTDIPSKDGNDFWQKAKLVISKSSDLNYKTLMDILTAMDKLPDHIKELMSSDNITIFIKDTVPPNERDSYLEKYGWEPAGTMNMETLEMTLYLKNIRSNPSGVIWHEAGHGVDALIKKHYVLKHSTPSTGKFLEDMEEMHMLGIRAYLTNLWNLNQSQIDEFLAGKEITGCPQFPKPGTPQRKNLAYYLSLTELLAEELDKSIEQVHNLEPEQSERRRIMKHFFKELHNFYKATIVDNPDLIRLIQQADKLELACKREFEQSNIRNLIEQKDFKYVDDTRKKELGVDKLEEKILNGSNDLGLKFIVEWRMEDLVREAINQYSNKQYRLNTVNFFKDAIKNGDLSLEVDNSLPANQYKVHIERDKKDLDAPKKIKLITNQTLFRKINEYDEEFLVNLYSNLNKICEIFSELQKSKKLNKDEYVIFKVLQDIYLSNKPANQLLKAINLFDSKERKFTKGIKYLKENNLYSADEIKAFKAEYTRNTNPRGKTIVINHTVVIKEN